MAQTKAIWNPSVLAHKLVGRINYFFYQLSVGRFRGFDLYLNSPDRLVLEDVIIPYFLSRSEYHKILFVGCDWYTKPYRKLFRNKEYWTIEIEEWRKKYGAERHIVDGLQNLSLHIQSGYFDVIICNGVFGHGLNVKEDMEEALNQCFNALREGGVLVFGWNNVPQYAPFPVTTECENFKKFKPYVFEPFPTSEYLVPNTEYKHTFDFYKKPVAS
ncbi:methyltransferase domain-containing protein [Scytonema sp. PCC 10023]|uniref:methyltransferase domain-containing protein n=1 Tax=Scytonema sp. PCC 10023 TaxID=1680591 RepID=UPI0039C68747